MTYFSNEDEVKIIQIIEGEMEVYDDDNLYDKLFEHYMDEMPYGTQKARDGDPYEWIFEHLVNDFGHLTEVIELTQVDLEKG